VLRVRFLRFAHDLRQVRWPPARGEGREKSHGSGGRAALLGCWSKAAGRLRPGADIRKRESDRLSAICTLSLPLHQSGQRDRLKLRRSTPTSSCRVRGFVLAKSPKSQTSSWAAATEFDGRVGPSAARRSTSTEGLRSSELLTLAPLITSQLLPMRLPTRTLCYRSDFQTLSNAARPDAF
jgi:hypothetical protein